MNRLAYIEKDRLAELEKAKQENQRLRSALEDAKKAIESLPDDSLGMGGKPGPGQTRYYLKNELLSKINKELEGDG